MAKKTARRGGTDSTVNSEATVEIWAEDEHPIGLQPVTRPVWVEALSVPIAKVNWKREWLWLYGFVQPQTGDTGGFFPR